jgi:hypothetical protein
VPFIEASYESGSEDSDVGPAHGPSGVVGRGQGGAPRAEEQDAQGAVADDVTCLANVEVPVSKVRPVQAEEEMQQRIKNPAGVVGREHGRGFDRNDDQPENSGDPRFQNLMSIGAQEDGLLDAIVGGLASDHYVVDVTFAESSAADADEAGFLQKLRDVGAAAVAHA